MTITFQKYSDEICLYGAVHPKFYVIGSPMILVTHLTYITLL